MMYENEHILVWEFLHLLGKDESSEEVVDSRFAVADVRKHFLDALRSVLQIDALKLTER